MPPSGPAITAVSAGDMALARDTIAAAEAAHFAAELNDLARILVADRHRHRHGLLRPRIPVIDMHIGAANGRAVHLDENVVVTDRRLGNVLHPNAGFRARLDECFHGLLPLLNDAKVAS